MPITRLGFWLSVLFLCAACATPLPPATPVSATPAAPPPATTLTLVTHDSFDISQEVLSAFTEQTGIAVQVLKSGDAGEMLNTMLLSKENPLGDVVYGVDNTFLSRALDGGLFAPHPSPLLADIPDESELDPSHRLLPVDFGFVTLNYDSKWFREHNLPPPSGIEDLAKPEYKGLTVVQNPATSSPGLAFLLVTIGRFGETGDRTYLDYWQDLVANDVLVSDGWSESYYNAFTVGSGGRGERPIVVSYATSPAAEVFFNNLNEPPSGSVNSPGSSFLQVEFAGVIAKSPHQEAARQLVDFLLSEAFQNDIPLHMFVYPANNKADVGDLFRQWAQAPAQPVTMPPAEIAAQRERWINDWTKVVLR